MYDYIMKITKNTSFINVYLCIKVKGVITTPVILFPRRRPSYMKMVIKQNNNGDFGTKVSHFIRVVINSVHFNFFPKTLPANCSFNIFICS